MWRRVGVCLLTLAALDQAVAPILEISERRHYESGEQLRFRSLDLFPLGPLTEYLQAHPVGPKPRVGLFGNSVMWGYLLEPTQTVAAVLQRLTPDAQVFDFSAGGFQGASSYLLAKTIPDSLDLFYVFVDGRTHTQPPHALLPKVIPVSRGDAARFGLAAPAWYQAGTARLAGCWRLGRYSYRLQAAWFGTSTQQAIRLKIEQVFNRVTAPPPAFPPVSAAFTLDGEWYAPVGTARPSPQMLNELAQRYPVVWQFAQLLAQHHKRAVFFQFAGKEAVREQDLALLNAQLAPEIVIASLRLPAGWFQSDKRHLTPDGAEGVARLLAAHAGGERWALR